MPSQRPTPASCPKTNTLPYLSFFRLVRLLAALAAIGLAAPGCSDETKVEGTPAVVADADGQADALDSAEPEVEEDTAGSDVQAIDLGAADVPYKSIPCQNNEDCASLVCQMTPAGKECAQPCITACPSDYECLQTTAGGDIMNLCLHRAPFQCLPCAKDADCDLGKGNKGLCVDLGKGSHCVQPCGEGKSCVGAGFTCTKQAAGSDVCVPPGNQCSCADGKSGACKNSNAFGTCAGSYTCTAGTEGSCGGQIPEAESCNLKDDDCDGGTDEEVAAVDCPIKNVYGECKGKTQCVGGQVLCQGAGAAAEVCNDIDDNCSGQTDEGFVNSDGDPQADCVDADDDGDGASDAADNCPVTLNADQTDTDGDGQGDACDPDDDNDKIFDNEDNCPLAANATQADGDGDGLGNACDCDGDGDGIANPLPANSGTISPAVACPGDVTQDNCPLAANSDQLDGDGDGAGDACDGDQDSDTVANGLDNCPMAPNTDQANQDKDGQGDACDDDDDNDSIADLKDNCPLAANPSQTDLDEDLAGDPCDADMDGDGVANGADNCPGKSNADQADVNANKIGDVCENDWDSDGVANSVDNCPWAANPAQADADTDLQGDACDCDSDADMVVNNAAGCPQVTAVDNCPAVANTDQKDLDEDGLGDACDPDKDGDGDPNASDCQPANKAISKLAKEVCNGVDDDCDSGIDEADAEGCKAFYFDEDADGFGVTLVKCLCGATAPYSASGGGDCNDADAAIHPKAKELCGNGKDDNCNGSENDVDAQGCNKFYADGDGDGVGDGAGSCLCTATSEVSAKTAGDCNDKDPAIAPNQAEKCSDTKDNDCNGQTDEENCLGCTVLFLDGDGDGFGIDGDKKCLTMSSGKYKAQKGGDCDDGNAKVYPSAAEACNQADDNCNGATDEENASGCIKLFADGDGDSWGSGSEKCLCAKTGTFVASQAGDCNDLDGAVHPAQPETCGNGKDDNCNGSENDENAKGCIQFYSDVDGDGAGIGAAKCSCSPAGNYTAKQGGDCLDTDPAVYPAQTEKCLDTKDNNCNGQTDESGCQGCSDYFKDGDQDGYGIDGDKQCLGAAKYPYTAFVGGDCNDGSANAKPGAAEVCNGADDNCDGQTDPIGATGCSNFYPDKDKDQFGANVTAVCYCKATGEWTANKTGDCNDNEAAVYPGKAETCNGVDDNCNSQADENTLIAFYKDNDGDGYGSVTSQLACTAPKGYTAESGDCNDFNKNMSPGAKEVCNDLDDDCNSLIDDGLSVQLIYKDNDGDSFASANAAKQEKCNVPVGWATAKDVKSDGSPDWDCDDSDVTIYPGALDLCDGKDNDCNGSKDQTCPTPCAGKWPVFMGPGDVQCPVAPVDLDNDGTGDLIVGCRAQVLNALGEKKIDLPGCSSSWWRPTVAQLDARPDFDWDVVCLNGVYDRNGKRADISGSYGSAAVGDVTGDGVPDVATSIWSGYVLNAGTWDGNGKWGPGKVHTLVTDAAGAWEIYSPVMVDLDGDGVLEVMAGSGYGSGSEGDHPDGRIYAWRYDKASDSFKRFCPLDPANPDKCWATGQKYWWTSSAAVLDYSGNGKTELVFPPNGGYLLDATGNVLASGNLSGLPMDLTHSGKWSWGADYGSVFADLNGDGVMEQLAGNNIVGANGKSVPGWPVPTKGGGVQSSTVADMDHDGRMEVMFGDGQYMACYELGENSWSPERIDWWGDRMYLNPMQFNGQYDSYEPNGDPAKAPILAGPQGDIQAFIDRQGDVDYYRLPIFGYWTGYTVTISGLPTGINYDLEITNADGSYASCSSANAGDAADSCYAFANVPNQDFKGYFLVKVKGKTSKDKHNVRPYRLKWTKNNY